MTPRWERRSRAPDLDGGLLMDAELSPHRSLSPRAFRWMLIAVIAVNAGAAAFFVARGAAPVAGFLGLDVLGIWLAFHLNYRAARARERVRVAPMEVHVERQSPAGRADHWVASTAFARVAEDEISVLIRSGGGQVRVGAFLSPPERTDFARALDAALWRAKNRR